MSVHLEFLMSANKPEAYTAQANRILAKLGPGWRVYERPRAPQEAHEVMRRELTERLGCQVVAPPRPASPPGNVVSRELIAEAAFLVVSTQFGSPQMLQRELKATPQVLGYLLAFLQGAKILEQAEGMATRAVLYPAHRAELLRQLILRSDLEPKLPGSTQQAVPSPQDAPSPVLLANATRLLVRDQRVRAEALQKELHIGNPVLASVLDVLEQLGVLGPLEEGQGRKVLITKETPDQVAVRILEESAELMAPRIGGRSRQQPTAQAAAPLPVEEPQDAIPTNEP